MFLNYSKLNNLNIMFYFPPLDIKHVTYTLKFFALF